jgi:AP-2 complex subunit alpha
MALARPTSPAIVVVFLEVALLAAPLRQVAVKSSFSGADGKLTIFVGNKCTVPLVAFKLRVPPFPAVTVTVGDAPSTIAPKAQVQVPVTLACLQPFVDPPMLQLSFISTPGTGHAYPLQLPIAVHSFCEAVAMPPADFKTRWTGLAGAPREVTAIISPASGGGAVSAANAGAALQKITMAAIDAGAPGPTGACSFRTHSVAPTGQKISVGCLSMIIPDSAGGAFKVAVRSQHPDVSRALMQVLQAQLETL